MSKKQFPIRMPRYAKGIRAQNVCSARWLKILEQKDIGGRFVRGRHYALSGQVVDLGWKGPHIDAQVMGMRKEAYGVTVDFRVPTGAARKRIVAALRSEPMLVARLLADDLPLEMEEIFRREGYDLFPGGRLTDASSSTPRYDMTTHCTCPDYANPCKHAHAVLLHIGEAVTIHPALLVALRGIRMEELYED